MQKDAAGLEHVAVMGDLERKIGVLLDQQDRQSKRSIDLEDLLKNCLNKDRRDSERRLVEHQAFWLAHQSSRDGQHLLFAAA
jgi:hypothetical protein